MNSYDLNLQREIVVYLKIWKKVKRPKVIRYLMKRIGVSNTKAATILSELIDLGIIHQIVDYTSEPPTIFIKSGKKAILEKEKKAILEIEKKYKLKEKFEIPKVLEAYKKSSKPFSKKIIQEIINYTGFDFRIVNGRLRQLISNEQIKPKKFQHIIEEFKKDEKSNN
jgi:signal recognition particle subunit SEC65